MLGALFGAASGLAGGAFNTQKGVDELANFMNEKSGAKATIAAANLQKRNLEKSVIASENKSVVENFNAAKRTAEAVQY